MDLGLRDRVDALYAASSAGAEVDLVVGDGCRLRPGVPGLFDTIRVRSIVGRYMQHVRIFRFGRAGARPRYYLGSADLHPRNLDRQVEVLAPVTDLSIQDRLEEILRVNLGDDVLVWELGPRGWNKVSTRRGHNSQRRLQDLAKQRRQRPSWMQPGDGWRGTATLDPGPVVQGAGGVVWRRRSHVSPRSP